MAGTKDKRRYRKVHCLIWGDDKFPFISDDAQLVETLGEKVAVVQTDLSNIKITQPADVAIAEAILKSRPKAKPKGPTCPYIEAQW